MRTLVLILALGAFASPAASQYDDCPGCLLGLFADPELTSSFGTPIGPTMDIYLGLVTSEHAGLGGIEFSITGLGDIAVVWEIFHNPTIVLGSPVLPEINGQLGDGGMNIAWADCIDSNQALMKFTLLRPASGWPLEATIEVLQRFPPTNQTQAFPLFNQCDAPLFTATRVTAGVFSFSLEPACEVSAPITTMAPVQEGGVAQRSFTIRNRGGGVLSGLVQENCADFSIVNPVYVLASDRTTEVIVEFRPQISGVQNCLVEIGSSCGTIELSGSTTAVLPLADLHSSAMNLQGRKITVEGQVYIPTNQNLAAPSAWIQDASNRGVRIVNALDPALHDPGNKVRLTAIVQIENSSVKLDASFVSLVQDQLPALNPRILPIVEAASPAWDGTYIQVTGTILTKTLHAQSTDYLASDGLGTLVLRVAAGINAPLFEPGDFVVARGAGGRIDNSFALFVGEPNSIFLQNEACPGNQMVIGAARGAVGQLIEVPVRLQVPIQDVDAFGFELLYDANVLRFVEADCCGPTANWSNCDAHVTGNGVLVVGGFNATPIPAGSDGELVCLTFEVLQCEAADQRILDAQGLVDDIAGLGVCSGIFTCIECLSDGDVNLDGSLTPGDALCAFRSFLNGQTVPQDCDIDGTCEVFQADVNCDGSVTPGDALDIFLRWLNGNPTPADCFAAGAMSGHGAPVQSISEGGFRFAMDQPVLIGADRFALPLQTRPSNTPIAFAAEVTFPPEACHFESIDIDALTQWPALEAQELAPGRLLVGGFQPEPSRDTTGEGGWRTIAHLVFSGRPDRFENVTWHERRHSSPQSVLPGTSIFLSQPWPNPMRSGSVGMQVAVPQGTAPWVDLSVFDIAGRRVRSVHRGTLEPGRHELFWDGKDERSNPVGSGVYFLRLQAPDAIQQRKFAVLR